MNLPIFVVILEPILVLLFLFPSIIDRYFLFVLQQANHLQNFNISTKPNAQRWWACKVEVRPGFSVIIKALPSEPYVRPSSAILHKPKSIDFTKTKGPIPLYFGRYVINSEIVIPTLRIPWYAKLKSSKTIPIIFWVMICTRGNDIICIIPFLGSK